MPDNVFKYPGGKTQMASWIIEKFPSHHVYVEPFAGSAAVLANKPKSDVEVINDLDGDIVHFFQTLRDNGVELKEWLEQTPYSRKLHGEYASEFYDGYRPDDDIERAGRFFYLRESQFAQKYTGVSGFSNGMEWNQAAAYQKKVQRLEEWQDRFSSVQVEQLDFAEVFERYDRDDTLFYCDPPYVEEGDDLYSHSEFDHSAFTEALRECSGKWIVSYTDLPDDLRELTEVVYSQDRKVSMRKGYDEWEKENTERLALNFDPDTTESFKPMAQSGIGEFA